MSADYPHDDQCELPDGGRCFCWISRSEAEVLVTRKEKAEDRARMAEYRLRHAGSGVQ